MVTTGPASRQALDAAAAEGYAQQPQCGQATGVNAKVPLRQRRAGQRPEQNQGLVPPKAQIALSLKSHDGISQRPLLVRGNPGPAIAGQPLMREEQNPPQLRACVSLQPGPIFGEVRNRTPGCSARYGSIRFGIELFRPSIHPDSRGKREALVAVVYIIRLTQRVIPAPLVRASLRF